MSRKRKLPNIKERCRICLVDNECTTNLFDEILQSKLSNLSKCTSINIKDEHGLPNIICHICLYKLDMWNEFKEQFIRSNQMLLSQLELAETSDNKNSPLKRSYNLRNSPEDSLSDSSDKKKRKTDVPPLIPLDSVTDQTILKDMYISDDDVTSSKDSSQRAHYASNDDKCKKDKEQENKDDSNVQLKPTLVPMKVKPLIARRNITERRKASTKRWVARKKALLAATGESVSDTDSMASDETQLSPVQKARAKTNMDKEVEARNRLNRTLKELVIDMTDKYGIGRDRNDFMSIDSDSDTRRTKSPKDSDTSLTEAKNMSPKESIEQDIKKKDQFSEDSKEKENSSASMPDKTADEKSLKTKDETEINEDRFTPCSVKSELVIGDATYIVTSTLMLAEPQYLNKANLNTLSKELKNGGVEQNSQEKNTDIIDAVQLRRINPIPTDANDKKCVERCLNIEVEGTEMEALKRVQVELANFVEKEMKPRLFGADNDDLKSDKIGNICKNSYQTLDQQLKNIIKKTIKKNFESSMMKSCGSDFASNTESETVSADFIKEAMNSKKYQPVVSLKRLDISKESKVRNINNMHVLVKRTVKSKLGGPFSMVSHKRQSVLPIRYNDYNTSALDSDSYFSDEMESSETSRTESHNVQKPQESKGKSEAIKQVEEPNVVDSGAIKNERKIEVQENIFKVTSSQGEKHVCGVCEQSFSNRNDAVVHVRVHKTETTSMPRQNKHKMMRCKRCHEIVEARFVKAHVCKSTKQQIHKCYVCNSTFRTEKLLVRHLENHDQSEFNIENITKGESQKSASTNASANSKESSHQNSEKSLLSKQNQHNSDNVKTKVGDVQTVEKVGTIRIRGDVLEADKPKETYTCFVCDKIFTDEEILKDHLQKHCDDMSEDDQSPGKEQFQCAICGDSLDSEDALEAHVEKHLFDEEDDNPNLINIANEAENSKTDPFQCLQCAETFNSEMLLEMHMQAHEEEAAIAEWEKQGIKAYEYQCMICDELFETEEDLSEHLDIHNGNAHVCQLCDKPFSSLGDLQKHVATH